MGYWDNVVRFHEKASKDIPAGKEGLRAIRFLRSFFEQREFNLLDINHPLRNRLRVVFHHNYLWLMQYAQKLFTISSLSGFEEHVAKRLGIPKEYLNANNEIEVALKLHLEGLPVSFTRDRTLSTPDLTTRINNDTIKVEVSSLQPSDEETLIKNLYDDINLSCIQNDVTWCGFLNRLPSHNKLEDIIKQVKVAIDRAKETNKVEKLNFSGIATIILAPNNLSDQMPEDCRGNFSFRGPPKRTIEEKIQRKIKDKSKQLFSYDEPVFLYIYTHIIDRQIVYKLFSKKIDEIVFVLATYPKLFGLSLTVPHLRIEIPSAIKSDSLQIDHKKNKVFLESEVGFYQYESTVIWKNPLADYHFPTEIQHALERYSSNLTKLEGL
jgi:hypothetical protein